jgi:hypothetical protein
MISISNNSPMLGTVESLPQVEEFDSQRVQQVLINK